MGQSDLKTTQISPFFAFTQIEMIQPWAVWCVCMNSSYYPSLSLKFRVFSGYFRIFQTLSFLSSIVFNSLKRFFGNQSASQRSSYKMRAYRELTGLLRDAH